MRNEIIFVGNLFKNNSSFYTYLLRHIESNFTLPDATYFFNDSDKRIFLTLEKLLQSECNLLIITTKNNFSVIGKLLCTITQDNQILKDSMLIPSKTELISHNSYLLKHKNASINVLHSTPQEQLPNILLRLEEHNVRIQLFDESIEDAKVLLEPIAQTYDIQLYFTPLVDKWAEIIVSSKRYGNISMFLSAAKQLLPNNIINASNIIAYIIEVLHTHSKKITFAESCTGGLLAYTFTKESGTSSILDGSLVSYSNALKENWLGVNDKTLQEFGAVSEEVVQEMSEGAINVTFANYAISVSGIAGPTGAVEGKPVGTVCISVRSESSEVHQTFYFKGDRNYIQEQSVLSAIKMLILLDKKTFFKF